jgi:hypothetical protein
MKVIIDGVAYVPASDLSQNADETAKALIRALVGGYYTTVQCHRSACPAPRKGCDCAGCEITRAAITFVGGHMEDWLSEPLISKLLQRG